ncbi:MAG: undecaprenyl-diphosphate phosphatase [Burkholderiales bacterium]
MDLALLIKAFILGIVEGATEFLPVSSTGHLVIASQLMGMKDERTDLFLIVIQFAAILAVCWEYRARIFKALKGILRDEQSSNLSRNILVAFLPLAVLGLLFGSKLKNLLFAPVPIAIAFIVGGLVILWAERREHTITVNEVDDMTWKDALKIGIAQAFALIPGTSRSGATIIGGLLFGLSRKAAAEFTFFLAVPTLGAATFYDLYKHRDLLNTNDIGMWAVGLIASFASAFLVVRGLIRYVSKHDFTIFAWYRIAFGIIVLVTGQMGWVKWAPG